MVQQINCSPLTALRVGQATSELARITATPYDLEIGFDLETTGKYPRKDKLVMIQLKPKGKKAVLIDARDEDRGVLHRALLPLVTDSRRTFVGQNLLFELSWLLDYLGFEVDDLRARFSDTMLRELVILGLGFGDAAKRGLAVNMHDIAERYGLAVHKEERSWFIDLDQRPDEWSAPFPQAQLEYGRQDVSVVHLISAKQQELIDEYGLQEVIDIEARALPATAGMQHYGMAVDRPKWLGFIQDIDKRAEELAAELHTHVDVPVLEHRRQAWLEKAQPYQAWIQERDVAVEQAKVRWTYANIDWANEVPGTQEPGDPPTEWMLRDGYGMKWGEFKKKFTAEWVEDHPKPKAPLALKDGVNLNSSDQMQVAFRSRGHQLESTAEEVLTPLAAGDPVIQLYLDWKDYQTARTKYGPAFLEEHAANGVLYAFIQQIGAETGRFAFKEPNIQQVPARGAGEHLREAIVPRHGYRFLDIDFTNVELMIAAYITRDPVMLQAFADGADLHARTAEVMFDLLHNQEYVDALAAGVTPKKWTDSHDAVVGGKLLNGTSYRSIAKTINFGLLYGMGAGRLAATLRIDINAAKQLMRLYRETYSGAVGWLRAQGQRIENPDKDGRVYAATLSGRRRWFELPKLVIPKTATAAEAQDALEKHKKQIAGIQRQLGNHPIQGTSADITKLAIALWHERYNCNSMRLICTIHDELLLEVEDNPVLLDAANARLGECMHAALTHFLAGMEIKVPSGKPSDHWTH